MAQKFIPQDMQQTFSYGISFFKLVLDPHVKSQSNSDIEIADVVDEVDSVPVVESTVTSMAFAAEAATAAETNCPETQAKKNAAVAIAVLNKDRFVGVPVRLPKTINVNLREELHKAQSEMRHLQFMRNLNLEVAAEKYEIAIENALENMEVRLQQFPQAKKQCPKVPRIHVRKKVQHPA
jgi:hypothetical protein